MRHAQVCMLEWWGVQTEVWEGDIVEVHCYVVDIGQIDIEQLRM